MSVSTLSVSEYGPLAMLAGTWEGDNGIDIAPTPNGPAETRYRERVVIEPVEPVRNGGQVLYGLRYQAVMWSLENNVEVHQECGYLLRDPGTKLVMRSFSDPRGIVVMAGGSAADDATIIEMSAEAEADTLGILSNPYLVEAAKTIYYGIRLHIHDQDTFTYLTDAVLRLKDQPDLFHHTDQNSLKRV